MALRQLGKCDKGVQRRIVSALREIEALDDPRLRREALTGNLRGKWRCPVGDWRVLREIVDDRLIVLVIEIGHRSKVYVSTTRP